MSASWVRTAIFAAVLCGFVVLLPFGRPKEHPHGIQVHPPSDGPLLHERYPQLYQIDRDLASGRLSLFDAVDIVLPLIQESYRLSKGTEFRGKGLRPGVAVMLCDWVEKMAEENPESVQDDVLERLHEECLRLRGRP